MRIKRIYPLHARTESTQYYVYVQWSECITYTNAPDARVTRSRWTRRDGRDLNARARARYTSLTAGVGDGGAVRTARTEENPYADGIRQRRRSNETNLGPVEDREQRLV